MPPANSSSNSSQSQPKSNERNEYIPSFIAKKPFYIDDATASDSDYLEHQRLSAESRQTNDSLATAEWYARGTTKGPAATKYRKGACQNCGSLSHKEKDCLQRKRKAGAKWTGKDIAADEVVKEVKLGWDAKRDRWNGFESGEFAGVVKEFEEIEAMRKAAAGEEEDGGERYEAETDMGRSQKNSTRNLRLREDTAKYLKNLDLESARYDPKTRSMEAGAEGAAGNDLVAEEGFERASGDAAEFERASTYAWETQERGDKDKLHMQANPTEALLLRKRKAEDELQKAEAKRKLLADKYGDQAAVSTKPKTLAAGVQANERYVEYDERGRIKGGEEKRKEKSMYPEDILINNHTSVWGSWWRDFKWGYACCHSIVKNSFCTGEEGRQAAVEAENFSKGLRLPPAAPGRSEEVEKEEAWKEEEKSEKHVPNDVDRPEKSNLDESRRRLEELSSGVTEAEIEKYRRAKTNSSDPMNKLLGKDELLE